jgi:hypothetical protein
MTKLQDNYPYTLTDTLFQLVRLAVLGFLCFKSYRFTCKSDQECSGGYITLSILLGYIVYFMLM